MFVKKYKVYIMNVTIIPTVREVYKNQFEYSIDRKLIKFLKFVFGKKLKIAIYDGDINKNTNLIILSGGNDVLKKKTHKKDLLRFKIDLKAYKFCSRYKKPLLGICHGAQFIGYMNNFKFEKKKHVGNHKVFVKYKLKFFKNMSFKVNSFHNNIIKKTNIQTKNICLAKDNSIELFKLHKKKMLGIMWHPERCKNFRTIDKKIIKYFYEVGNSFSG